LLQLLWQDVFGIDCTEYSVVDKQGLLEAKKRGRASSQKLYREDCKVTCLFGLSGLANRFCFGSKNKVAHKRSYQPHLGQDIMMCCGFLCF
jgi:hypothetical protein